MTNSKNGLSIFRNLLFLGAGFLASSGLNYFFHVSAGRYLGPDEYGILSVLLSLIAIVGVTGQVLQLSVIHGMTDEGSPKTDTYLFDNFTTDVLFKVSFLVVLLCLLSPIGAHLLGIDTILFCSVALFCYPSALEWIARGRLIGLRSFRTLSVFIALQSIAKMCVLVLAVITKSNLTFISFGISFSSLLITCLSLWTTRHGKMLATNFRVSKNLLPMMSLTLFWIMISADIIYARFSLETMLAGQYAANSFLGTATLWIPIMIIQLKYPDMVIDSKTTSRRSNQPLLWIALSGTLTSLFLWLFGSSILEILYGSEFQSSPDLAWKISIACIPFGITNYLQHELVALGSYLHVKWLSVCVLSEMLLMYLFPQTPNFIILALFLSGSASVFVTSRHRKALPRTPISDKA